MQQVVVTVEAMRCWQCQNLMHPTEPFFRRQMITAVETSARRGDVLRKEPVNLCAECHAVFQEKDEAEANRKKWWRIWFFALIAAFLIPYGMIPLGGAIIWRNAWKWQAKRRQLPPAGVMMSS